MKGATFFDGKVIPLVGDHQIQNRSFGQRRRFVDYQAAVLDTCSERAHVDTVGLPDPSGQDSRARRNYTVASCR